MSYITNGQCPECGSSRYGQEPINMRENQCLSCGHIGPVSTFHTPRPLKATTRAKPPTLKTLAAPATRRYWWQDT